MLKRPLLAQIVITMLGILSLVLMFEFSHMDMWVQNYLFQVDSGQWLLDKHDETLSLIFYDAPKRLLVFAVIGVLLVLLIFRQGEWVKRYRQGMVIVLLSLFVTVTLVGWLKSVTNVPCPKDLSDFGGSYPHVTLLHRLPAAEHMRRVRCFPAGHASGGFALLSLYFLFRRRRNRWIGLGIGMAVGWTFGLYKMLIGDHFLSHTLVTMGLAWLVSLCIAACVYRVSGQKVSDSLTGTPTADQGSSTRP